LQECSQTFSRGLANSPIDLVKKLRTSGSRT